MGLFLILLIVTATSACPYYTLMPRTNYSTMTELLNAPIVVFGGVPAYACVGARVYSNETLPLITFDFSLTGDFDPIIGAEMILQIDSASLDPVFVISGTSGYASFHNIQFTFNQTLFLVNHTGLLNLQGCTLWIGNFAVVIQTSTSVAGVSGFVGSKVIFAENALGIHQITGFAVCDVCYFIRPRVAGVSTRSEITSRFQITYSVWNGDTQWIYIIPSTLSNVNSDTDYQRLPLPSNWGRINKNFMFDVCEALVSQSQSPTIAFGGGGGGGGGGDGGGDGNNGSNAYTIALLAAVIAGILVVIAMGFK